MKTKTLLILLLIAVAVVACNQSNTYQITGRIENIPDGGAVQLFTVEGNAGRLFNAYTIRGGSFSFEGEVDSLQELQLVVFDEKFPLTTFPIWIAPGAKVKIIGKGNYPGTWDINSNVREQQEEEIYRNAVKDIAMKYDSLDLIYRSMERKINIAKNEEQKQKLIAEIRSIQEKQDVILFNYYRKIFEVMASQPVTENWINRLVTNAGYANALASDASYPEKNQALLQNLYNRLTDEQKQSRKGQVIYAYVYPVATIKEDDPMAKGRFFDPQGAEHEITDFANKGKHILLDFWGVGCAPCIAAFPEMKEIYKAHKDKLTIISVSTDTHDIWQDGLKKHQLPWVNLNDFLLLEGYALHYGVRGIPFYVLISPDGIVQKTWSGYSKGSLKEKLKGVI